MTLNKIVSGVIRLSVVSIVAGAVATIYFFTINDRPIGWLDLYAVCLAMASIVLPTGWIWE